MAAKNAPDGATRRQVHELTKAGWTSPRRIAMALGISVQAVHYHLKKIEELRAAAKARHPSKARAR